MKMKKNLTFSTIVASLAFLTIGLFAGETYEYDLQGRLAKITYEDSTSIAYTYDNNGNILTIEVAGDIGTSVEGPLDDLLPKVFALAQNFPNPFNPSTQIKYQLPIAAQVKITIYNMLGRQVRTLVNEEKPAGFYNIQWDGVNGRGVQAASGLYLYRIVSNGVDGRSFVVTKKMGRRNYEH